MNEKIATVIRVIRWMMKSTSIKPSNTVRNGKNNRRDLYFPIQGTNTGKRNERKQEVQICMFLI